MFPVMTKLKHYIIAAVVLIGLFITKNNNSDSTVYVGGKEQLSNNFSLLCASIELRLRKLGGMTLIPLVVDNYIFSCKFGLTYAFNTHEYKKILMT